MRRTLLALVALQLAAVPLWAQGTVLLEGLAGERRSLTADELAALPQRTVVGASHGKTARFRGVPLDTLLKLVGAPLGGALRGRALTTYVVIEAADGYGVVFSLAELDAGMSDRVVVLANRRNGVPLSERDGPLQVIVPGEKRAARWVRQVRAIRLMRAAVADPQ